MAPDIQHIMSKSHAEPRAERGKQIPRKCNTRQQETMDEFACARRAHCP